jgi:hypothetical protein
VQARHYDGHDYMAEKLQALQTLHAKLSIADIGDSWMAARKRVVGTRRGRRVEG